MYFFRMSACLLFPRTWSIKDQVECSLQLWIRETSNSWAVGNDGSFNHSWVTHPRSELATFKKLLQFFVCLVSEHTVGGSQLVSMNHAQLHKYQKHRAPMVPALSQTQGTSHTMPARTKTGQQCITWTNLYCWWPLVSITSIHLY